MWVWSGFVLSLGLAALAWWRCKARAQTFYEEEVYGMGAAGHRTCALAFAIAAALFLAELAGPAWIARIPEVWRLDGPLALVVLGGILYGATFLRGATGEDE